MELINAIHLESSSDAVMINIEDVVVHQSSSRL